VRRDILAVLLAILLLLPGGFLPAGEESEVLIRSERPRSTTGALPVAGVSTSIFVELAQPEPVVVARWRAQREGRAFDADSHRAAIRAAQDQFLRNLTLSGITATLTQTGVLTGTRTVPIDNRYLELINCVHLTLPGADVIRIRRMPEVRHISLDTPRYVKLDHSVGYIRANGPASARTAGFRGTGAPNPDGTASGQVIAYLDTGIDHTHPMFDTTRDDEHYTERLGDTRIPRHGGEPYVPGTHHPKVIYRAEFHAQQVIGDDQGHGTAGSSAAAGLKAQTPTGEIVEGVAPGALLMDYKVCPSLVCNGALVLQSLDDAVREVDSLGNPKPVATVVNMSLGSCDGDPRSADAIAAGNLQYAGVVPMASAGNLDTDRSVLCDDHDENTLDSPASGRLVVAVGASLDPGAASVGLEALQFDQGLHDSILPADSAAMPALAGHPKMAAVQAPESRPMTAPLAQHYVHVGFADTPDDVPPTVAGRICLAERGGDVDVGGATGSGLFGNKATQCSARGGIALVVFNNVSGPVGSVLAPAAIPVVTISREDGLRLRDTLGFESPAPGALSRYPLRLNPNDPAAFDPDTAGFSCKGPNNDFAVVKPDIIAPGEGILMAAALASGEPTRYAPSSGTSFSSPHAAGTAALIRDPDVGRPDFTPSMVRAALMNSATNHRLGDGVTPIPEDHRFFLHEIGAGLVEMVRATSAGTLMGTNELNGPGGPDDVRDPDFLPSHSFGELRLIGTGRSGSDPAQRRAVTVTMTDVGGGGGTFDLGLVDAGDLRGDVTRPITSPGFAITLGQASVTVPPGGSATFEVGIAIDGTDSGLQTAGADDDGIEGTDLAWFVTAQGARESLRMPFFVRAAPGGGNQPPVARDDSASTAPGQPVTVAVLLNDSDSDGDTLSVISVGQPARGSATSNGDGTITYTPQAGFLGSDSFSYTVTDGTAQDEAIVTVEVTRCPPANDGIFTDDFEPQADEGWQVQTAVAPALTTTWSVRPDPLAHSPTQSFFTDAAVPVGEKDDRLISPPQDLTEASRLVFWHRFSTEETFDGGVLEVSRDGGSTWVDVASGGTFLEGGYNSTIGGGARPGWSGTPPSSTAMGRVEVDLGGFAGQDVLVRWRLLQDGNTGTGGWWVDDVQFSALSRPAATCNLPPDAVDDHGQTVKDTPVIIDVLANDSDPDGDPLSTVGVTTPQHGAAHVNADNSITYTPAPGYVGPDAFSYSASDGQEDDTAVVTVDVRLPALPGRTSGSGWIPDGSGKASFRFNAQRDGSRSTGQIAYDAEQSNVHLQGTVLEASVSAFEGDFAGTCTLSDGRACTFAVRVQDAAEPGKGADRFQIRVLVQGSAVHEAAALLGGGNIQVRPTD
jgi:hypothetical protein